MDDFQKDNLKLPEDKPREDSARPSSLGSRRLRFGRGVYGSKDVPIRVLDVCITIMIVLCILLIAWNSVHGGFVISFDSNGGDLAVPAQSVRHGNPVTEPEPPVRPGYDFKGWSISADTFEPWSFQNSTASGDMVLYAFWVPAEITVKFDLNGGVCSGKDTVEAVTVTYGKPYGTLPVPEKEGYTFAGWIYSGKPITEETKVFMTGEHVLTASWET